MSRIRSKLSKSKYYEPKTNSPVGLQQFKKGKEYNIEKKKKSNKRERKRDEVERREY